MDILDCGHPVSPHSKFTAGYGVDANGAKHCYDCCAARDRADMEATGRATLYLSPNDNPAIGGAYTAPYKLTNWPGSLALPVWQVCKGRHNIARNRYDFWFTFGGRDWHGVQYGDNTQIAHCRRLKERAA